MEPLAFLPFCSSKICFVEYSSKKFLQWQKYQKLEIVWQIKQLNESALWSSVKHKNLTQNMGIMYNAEENLKGTEIIQHCHGAWAISVSV